jgi:6-phosphogluconolactonase
MAHIINSALDATKTLLQETKTSFPRKRESRKSFKSWIPACAGMTSFAGMTKRGAKKIFIKKWHEISNATIKEHSIFTVALSGGKTPVPFYQQLNKQNLAWDRIHIFLVDERVVPLDHPDSNYRLIKEHLSNAKHIYAMTTAQDYEQTLIKFFNTKLPRFDLIMLGIGEDGHTVSLFSNDPALLEKEKLVVAVKNNKVKYDRITLTLPIINNAKNIIFLAGGKNKAKVIAEVKKQNPQFPASKVQPTHGHLLFLISGDNHGRT